MGRTPYHKIGGPDGLLSRREDFKGHSMRARNVDPDHYHYPSAREPVWVKGMFQQDKDERGIRYIVWSYGTIIAWVTADGETVVPNTGYSKTTTRQQNLCRAWL